jgi:hypothetical protein
MKGWDLVDVDASSTKFDYSALFLTFRQVELEMFKLGEGDNSHLAGAWHVLWPGLTPSPTKYTR